MPDPDPCQLFIDAVEAAQVEAAAAHADVLVKTAALAASLTVYDDALTLLDERVAALDQCREENSVEPLMATEERKKIAAKREKLKQLKAELETKD